MRITHDILLKIARDAIARQTQGEHGILAAYLCGSLLEDEFLLGGTTDVDLVFIHSELSPKKREIIPITPDVHLDIAHHGQGEYRHPRMLRVHPWLGPTLNSCMVLYDPQHLLDFTQASVRGQFTRPDYVLERSRKHSERSRQIWLGLMPTRLNPSARDVLDYLHAVKHAANAIASLAGPPLTERRFLTKFLRRAAEAGRPGLYAGLLGLLGAPRTDPATLENWIHKWEAYYDPYIAKTGDPRLHLGRKEYYLQALLAFLQSNHPLDALFPLELTWTQAVGACEKLSPLVRDWQDIFEELGLLGDGFSERIEALDAYLDLVEETLDQWALENGA